MAPLHEESGAASSWGIPWIAASTLPLILLINPKPVQGQSNWCEVVGFAVTTTAFQTFIEGVPCDSSIILFDMERVDATCSIPPSDCRGYEIRHDTIYNKLSPNRYDPMVSKYLLVIYGYHQKDRSFTIRFWRPWNNETLMLRMRGRKHRFLIQEVGRGVF